MAKLEFVIEIAAPLDRVFVFFVPQRMTHWYGTEMNAEFEVQGGASEFEAGQKMRIRGTVGRREVSLTAVVTRYEWQRVLEWQFRDEYGVRGVQRWELEATPKGTRVRMWEEYALPGWFGRVVDTFLMRWGVARRDRYDLTRLKRVAEAVSP